jgi:hypothetical protein
MECTPAVVSRFDHLTIRIDDARYDQLFAIFAETLDLPIAWSVAERYPNQEPGFKSGGSRRATSIWRSSAPAPLPLRRRSSTVSRWSSLAPWSKAYRR